MHVYFPVRYWKRKKKNFKVDFTAEPDEKYASVTSLCVRELNPFNYSSENFVTLVKKLKNEQFKLQKVGDKWRFHK